MSSTLGITLFIVLCLLAAEVGAEISVEKYSRAFGSAHEKKERWFMVGGILLYLAIPFLLLWLLRSSNHLTMANTLWQASNIVVGCTVRCTGAQGKLNCLATMSRSCDCRHHHSASKARKRHRNHPHKVVLASASSSSFSSSTVSTIVLSLDSPSPIISTSLVVTGIDMRGGRMSGCLSSMRRNRLRGWGNRRCLQTTPHRRGARFESVPIR